MPGLFNVEGMDRKNTVAGFTLIELLLTLGISGLLLVSVLALPIDWVKQHRFMHYTNRFLEALEFARSYAMVSGSATTICSSEDGERCSGTAYEKGWLVFTEHPDSINGILDYNERILIVQKADVEDISIRSQTFSQFVTYNHLGRANYNGRFILCTAQPTQAVSELVINHSGRVRLQQHQKDGRASNIGICSS